MDQLTPKVELVYSDESGTTAALTFFVPVGTTVATALDAAQALGAVVASLTGCVLVRCRIKYTMQVHPKPSAEVGASIARAGMFLFSPASPFPFEVVSIPGIREELLVTSGPCADLCVDTTNGDVDTFVSAVIGGIFVNTFGDDLIALETAYRQSRV